MKAVRGKCFFMDEQASCLSALSTEPGQWTLLRQTVSHLDNVYLEFRMRQLGGLVLNIFSPTCSDTE